MLRGFLEVVSIGLFAFAVLTVAAIMIQVLQ